MKFVLLLCILSALLLQIQASPVQLAERQERAIARQQAVNDVAPAVAPADEDDEDDDDDDDDDDEPDLGDLVDDDDGKRNKQQKQIFTNLLPTHLSYKLINMYLGNLKNNIIEMTNDAFQERHNQFIDSIFSRINRIVANNYDPFVVRLHARSATKKVTTAGSTAGGHTTGSTKAKPAKSATKTKLKNTKSEPRSLDEEPRRMEMSDAKTQSKLQEQLQQLQLQQEQSIKAVAAEKMSTVGDAKLPANTGDALNTAANSPEMRTVLNGDANRAESQKKTSNKAHKTHTKKNHSTTSNAHNNNNNSAGSKLKQNTKSSGNNNNVAIGKEVEKLQKAEGSLSGLASLKRVGNVKVVADPEGSNSTIKAKFTLGPLTLRVEKSFKRGSVHSVKSATARTNEMIGRIKFSVVNDRATLMSIKVQQPKQVEVESKDNHDRTREFVWRRTPKIAKLVNEKLKLAAESLFTTQGVEVVRL
ncbi:MATH and LRR domain-containing protein PFE0570w-like [Rhagoletis pomonella]|uniref:MATH and LRR domain-containing protein PFE0570w-like n=1 Tax=Rhagoletis pomonella TaxID=28610 RepID=UPI001780FE20|nr:MATH and LRR domain-containing protein PFE0570w-like [Rhagoletis pomonella]